MLRKIKWLVLLMAISITLVIAFQNTGQTEIKLVTYSIEVSHTMLIVVCLAAGFLIGALSVAWLFRGKKAKAPVTVPADSVN